MRKNRLSSVMILACLPGAILALAGQVHESGGGQVYQAVITKNPDMTIRNGQGEFIVSVQRGKVKVRRKDSRSDLDLIRTGNVYQVVDDHGSRLLIFAVYGAGSHGTQIVYPPHADSSNSRARIGVAVGGLEEIATMEDQRTLLRERSRSLGVDPDRALFVKSVAAGSPADRIGLKFGDVIAQVGDVTGPSVLDFQRVVFGAAEGSIVSLTVINLEGNRVHEVAMPPVPDPVEPAALDDEIREALNTSIARK